MSPKFIDILFSIVIRLHWRYIAYGILFGFVGSWELTAFYDPESPVVKPGEYWWYFINSVLKGNSMGYSPTDTGARMVSFCTSIFVSIFVVAGITKIVAATYEHTQRRKKGVAMIKTQGHIVFLGYREGETEAVIAQILADYQMTKPGRIVLCTRHLKETPYPGNPMIDFVHGDTASNEVLKLASVKDAATIVVTGHDDARTMQVCLAVNQIARKDAHIVAHVETKGIETSILQINPLIECVVSLRSMLIAQAIVNSGISPIIRELVDLDKKPSLFRINIPEDVPTLPFATVVDILLNVYKVIPIAIGLDHSPHAKQICLPAADTKIKGGMSLFYAGEYRLEGPINWDLFTKAQFMSPEVLTAKTEEVRESLMFAEARTAV